MKQILTEILALLKVNSRDIVSLQQGQHSLQELLHEIDQKLTCMIELQPHRFSDAGNNETPADNSVQAADSERIRIAKHGTTILKGKVT